MQLRNKVSLFAEASPFCACFLGDRLELNQVPNLLGRVPDQLTIAERRQYSGKWIAIELYNIKTLPLRRIEVVGDSVADCATQLKSKDLAPASYEFVQIHPAY